MSQRQVVIKHLEKKDQDKGHVKKLEFYIATKS